MRFPAAGGCARWCRSSIRHLAYFRFRARFPVQANPFDFASRPHYEWPPRLKPLTPNGQAGSGKMDAPPAQPQSLEDIRREIDRIDSAILKLVGERLAMVDRVRAFKNGSGIADATPIRPAREAVILRRLIETAAGGVPAEL